MFDQIATGRYWDKPWSLVSGCTRCSPGCDRCWALAMEARFQRDPLGWDGGLNHDKNIIIHPDRLDIPLKRKKPTAFAVWNDLFHEDVPQDFIVSSFMTMFSADRHIYFVLTKRAKRANEILNKIWKTWGTNEPYLKEAENVWLGVTVCNQKEADEKIPLLLQIPAAVRWVSVEPMLGPISLPWLRHGLLDPNFYNVLDWVVLGGETGPGARPLDPQWVESVRNQCAAAAVPFFFKSWGEWCGNYPGDSWEPNGMRSYYFPRVAGPKAWRCGKKLAGRLLDGRTWDELPTQGVLI